VTRLRKGEEPDDNGNWAVRRIVEVIRFKGRGRRVDVKVEWEGVDEQGWPWADSWLRMGNEIVPLPLYTPRQHMSEPVAREYIPRHLGAGTPWRENAFTEGNFSCGVFSGSRLTSLVCRLTLSACPKALASFVRYPVVNTVCSTVFAGGTDRYSCGYDGALEWHRKGRQS
jgi:hypothetical protein